VDINCSLYRKKTFFWLIFPYFHYGKITTTGKIITVYHHDIYPHYHVVYYCKLNASYCQALNSQPVPQKISKCCQSLNLAKVECTFYTLGLVVTSKNSSFWYVTALHLLYPWQVQTYSKNKLDTQLAIHIL